MKHIIPKSLLLPLLSTPFYGLSQTTIINPANATGTSGADGSFQNASNTFGANGVYLIQVNQEFGSKVYKIVVEHP